MKRVLSHKSVIHRFQLKVIPLKWWRSNRCGIELIRLVIICKCSMSNSFIFPSILNRNNCIRDYSPMCINLQPSLVPYITHLVDHVSCRCWSALVRYRSMLPLVWCRSKLVSWPYGLCVLNQLAPIFKDPKSPFLCCLWYCISCI